MASIWLDRHTLEDGDFPDVCMKCGRSAPDRMKKTFIWVPGWVYLFILINLIVLIIMILVMQKRRRARVPLCDEHKNHWRWRNTFAWVSFLIISFGAVSLGVTVGVLSGSEDSVIVVVLLGLLAFLAWLVTCAIMQSTAIRAMDFDGRDIRLTNVSPEFVQAYEDQLDEEDEWRRRRRRNSLDREVSERWNERSSRRASDDRRDRVRKERPDDRPDGDDRYRED